MNVLRVALLGSVAILGANSAAAAMVTLESQFDTTLYENNSARSNGAGTVVFAGTNSASSPRRGLLWFDVAGNIPSGATIDSASLTLHVASFAGTGGSGGSDPTTRTTSLYALERAWGEGTTGAGSDATGSGQGFATPTDGTTATWTHAFYNSDAWLTAGGDFAASASSTTLVSGTVDSPFTWHSTGTMVADIQGWLDNPTSNFGWILIGNESTSQTFRSFYSREASNAALRPMLTVSYTAVPEPSTWCLLAIGATGLFLGRGRVHFTQRR